MTVPSIPSSPAHQILVEQARKLSWPKYYTDDLTLHDLTHLADNPSEFLWAIRPNGTRLIRYSHESDTASYDAAHAAKGGQIRLYHYHNGKLTEVSPQQYLAACKQLPTFYSAKEENGWLHITAHTEQPRTITVSGKALKSTPHEYWDQQERHLHSRHYQQLWLQKTHANAS